MKNTFFIAASYTLAILLLVVLPLTVAIVGPSKPTPAPAPENEHELVSEQRIEYCEKLGLKPVVEFLSNHPVVTGCTP